MTFNKYKQGREKFNDCIFPDKRYDYNYVWTKKIGWHIVRGKKLKEVNMTNKINSEKLDKITELLIENFEYDLEINGPQDYDITPYLKNRDRQRVIDKLNEIMEEK